jgi:tetratricopeptide (TPR) repeat protein
MKDKGNPVITLIVQNQISLRTFLSSMLTWPNFKKGFTMPAHERPGSKAPEKQEIVAAPWRKRRIFAGILTAFIGFSAYSTIVLAATLEQTYRWLGGMLSGLGSGGLGMTSPLPAIILLLVLLTGGILFCLKRGRGRFIVLYAALISVPVGLWGSHLQNMVPGMAAPEPSLLPLVVNSVISIYLLWVLWNTMAAQGRFQDRFKSMFSLKNIGLASLLPLLTVIWVFSGDISNEIFKSSWEPSNELAGIPIGMTQEQVLKLKGKPDGYYGPEEERKSILAWHYRTSKRPDLLVYFDQDTVVKINTLSPRATGDKVPFKTVEEMREILGPEDIRSESYQSSQYTYIKWNLSYEWPGEWSGNSLRSINLGHDNWFYSGKWAHYYINGRQVCPGEACPWDDEDNLKPEYQNASYKDFINPSPELEKMLAESEAFEKARYRREAEESAIKLYSKKAALGDALSQYRLGYMYFIAGKSYGAIEDYPKALKWLRIAAKQDYSEAQHILGIMYQEGLGLPQDYAEAIKLYRLAAEKNFDAAQSSLGSMYMNGTGVPKDNVVAYMWFQLSAMGDNDALKNREILEKIMTQDEIQKANEMRKEWWDDFMSNR